MNRRVKTFGSAFLNHWSLSDFCVVPLWVPPAQVLLTPALLQVVKNRAAGWCPAYQWFLYVRCGERTWWRQEDPTYSLWSWHLHVETSYDTHLLMWQRGLSNFQRAADMVVGQDRNLWELTHQVYVLVCSLVVWVFGISVWEEDMSMEMCTEGTSFGCKILIAVKIDSSA